MDAVEDLWVWVRILLNRICSGPAWELRGLSLRRIVVGSDGMASPDEAGQLCAGFGCSVFMGDMGIFSFKPGGAAALNLQAQSVCRLHRRASGGPVLELLSHSCQMLQLSRSCCSLLHLSWEARSRTRMKRGFPLMQTVCSASRLCRGHRGIAHQFQGSHNSFKTITLFI